MAIIDIFVFAGGFVACWFGRDPITKLFIGAEAFAKNLEAKATAAKAAVTAVVK